MTTVRIGPRTFRRVCLDEDGREHLVETHLLDFAADGYGVTAACGNRGRVVPDDDGLAEPCPGCEAYEAALT